MNKEKFSKEVTREGHILLTKTCNNIIARSRLTEGTYKNVKCSFKSARKLRDSLKSEKKFMYKWYTLTKEFLEQGEIRPLRPVIDRIDEKGHYFKSNMQVLTCSENARKARIKKPCA
ncbi:hypothetical protein [Sutcliffiella horikoshii]|uniref:hypothetical protein n=1 Tax=Sutcliffiella horikoshii TaxID=79883 RepID=UPI001CFE767B|nr:hypothetical protein [Sutcliffiella horikoshii]